VETEKVYIFDQKSHSLEVAPTLAAGVSNLIIFIHRTKMVAD